MKKKYCGVLLVAVWMVLALWAWVYPSQDMSVTERRKLAQFPQVSAQEIFSGRFMEKFETYSQDQFPLRDSFRQLKAVFRCYVAGQKDNNNIYLAEGHLVKMEYPLNLPSLDNASSRFQYLYDTYLADSGCRVYGVVVPEKGLYLAEKAGAPGLDYDVVLSRMAEGMPWAQMIDITGLMDADCYYRTDIHWRQEKILPVAEAVCNAMGVEAPKAEDFRQRGIEQPFYGVYYGQAALPASPEKLYVMDSDVLEGCTVWNYETQKESQVYDMTKLNSRDLYDVFLSGPAYLLRIENPSAETDRELVVFRDSFGSSLVPLLVHGYKTVTLVDIRYIPSGMVGNYVDFHGQDVLFLYSAPVLGNSTMLK